MPASQKCPESYWKELILMKKEIWWKGILSPGFLWEKSEVSRWPQIMIICREIQEFPGGTLAEKTKCVSQLWRLVILSKCYKSPQSQSLVHLHDKYLFFVCKVLGIGLGLQKKQGMEQKQIHDLMEATYERYDRVCKRQCCLKCTK